MRVAKRASLLACLAVTIGVPAFAAEPSTLLRPMSVWTAGEPVHAGWVVLVTGKHIAAAGPADRVSVPPDARIIDLPGMMLLPGLMDLHLHLFLHPFNYASWDV